MAEDGEGRMLFDIRGRRKNVVRVVYAILALLMGTSLFFVVGPLNIGELVGNSASTSTAEIYEEEVEQLEERLAAKPAKEEQLLLRLTDAQLSAGNAKLDAPTQTSVPQLTPEATEEYEEAVDTWNRYLEQAGGNPDAGLAERIATTVFRVAETDTSVRAAEGHVAEAAKAERIAAEANPSVNSLTTLAYYEYFSGNFEAGDRAKREAEAQARAKTERKAIDSQLTELRKSAKQFAKRKKRLAKIEDKLGQGQSSGNPFALPGSGGSLGE